MTKDNELKATHQQAQEKQSMLFYQAMRNLGIQDVHGVELLRLVKMTANAYDTVTSERMRTQNLSAPRWRLLLRLWMEEHGGCATLSPTQLSQTQKISKNTVSAHLRSLEEQGLIERTLDPDDLRQFRIRLSAQGRSLVEHSTPGHMAFLNSLADDLAPAEIEQLQTLLQKLYSSLMRCAQLADPPSTNTLDKP